MFITSFSMFIYFLFNLIENLSVRRIREYGGKKLHRSEKATKELLLYKFGKELDYLNQTNLSVSTSTVREGKKGCGGGGGEGGATVANVTCV